MCWYNVTFRFRMSTGKYWAIHGTPNVLAALRMSERYFNVP